MDFGGLSVGVSCHDTLAEGFQAAHLRLDPAAGVVSGPALPERPSVVPRRVQGVVAGACSRAVFFPETSVLSDRDDRNGAALDDGLMAAACVVGAVGGDRAYLLACWDLAEQVGQHGAVAVAAGGEFHRSDVRCGRVHGQRDLAPLASALHPVLASLPFAIAEELDPSAVDQQVQRTVRTAIRDLDGQGLLPAAQRGKVRPGPVQASQAQQAGHHSSGLRNGNLNRTLTVKQNCMAASENTAGRPGRPSRGARQVMSLSTQMSRDPAS